MGGSVSVQPSLFMWSQRSFVALWVWTKINKWSQKLLGWIRQIKRCKAWLHKPFLGNQAKNAKGRFTSTSNRCCPGTLVVEGCVGNIRAWEWDGSIGMLTMYAAFCTEDTFPSSSGKKTNTSSLSCKGDFFEWTNYSDLQQDTMRLIQGLIQRLIAAMHSMNLLSLAGFCCSSVGIKEWL